MYTGVLAGLFPHVQFPQRGSLPFPPGSLLCVSRVTSLLTRSYMSSAYTTSHMFMGCTIGSSIAVALISHAKKICIERRMDLIEETVHSNRVAAEYSSTLSQSRRPSVAHYLSKHPFIRHVHLMEILLQRVQLIIVPSKPTPHRYDVTPYGYRYGYRYVYRWGV